MVKCVLEDFATKREKGISVVPVSVNISTMGMDNFDIVGELNELAEQYDEDKSLLNIEFTESAAVVSPELFKQTIEDLRSSGFNVWMDDFGSGYSSLNSLKNFSFDLVKLDMEFLRHDENPRTWNIISGVALMTKQLDMRLLAEGVETEEQAQHLEEVGCDILQGYFFAKPVPLEELKSSSEI